jgi:uncharacterized DUF497 family protein
MSGDFRYEYHGYVFTWDSTKAEMNLKKHGVSFEEACTAVLNEVQVMEEVSETGEQRWAIIAYARSTRFTGPLYVVTGDQGDEAWRIISARIATPAERKRYEEEVNA